MYETNQDELDQQVSVSEEQVAEEIVETERERALSPIIIPFLFSLLLAVLSVGNPYIEAFATNLQSQNIYAGWAIAQDQVMYSQVFGTSGLLYYLLTALSNVISTAFPMVTSGVLFALFYFLALRSIGSVAFQVSFHITQNRKLSDEVISVLYVLILILGFGGFYASIFAMPFLMRATLLLARYTTEDTLDNSFIGYGCLAALSFMFDPMPTLVFYLVAFFILFFFNVGQKRWARGLYQFLATLLGFSLIFYPLGYYTVWNGSFGDAIVQVLYPLQSLSFSHDKFLSNLIFYGAILLGMGFVTAWCVNLVRLTKKDLLPLRFLATLGLLVALVLLVASPEQGAYQVLSYLPFLLILLSVWLEGRVDGESTGRHRRRARNLPSGFGKYMTGSFFLPLLALAYFVAYPVVNHLIISHAKVSERAAVATYLKENSKDEDKIYAWDTTAQLYQATNRLSAASILTPVSYQGTAETRLLLTNHLNKQEAEFIVVNQELPLSKNVEDLLNQSYEEVENSYKYFTLYHKK